MCQHYLIIKPAAITCLIRIGGRMGSRRGLAASGMGRVSCIRVMGHFGSPAISAFQKSMNKKEFRKKCDV